MLIYALRLLKRNGGVASVQWVYVPTRPKWTIRRGCWRKGSGNCGPGWGQKEEGTDAEQDYYCQESAVTPTYGHGPEWASPLVQRRGPYATYISFVLSSSKRDSFRFGWPSQSVCHLFLRGQ